MCIAQPYKLCQVVLYFNLNYFCIYLLHEMGFCFVLRIKYIRRVISCVVLYCLCVIYLENICVYVSCVPLHDYSYAFNAAILILYVRQIYKHVPSFTGQMSRIQLSIAPFEKCKRLLLPPYYEQIQEMTCCVFVRTRVCINLTLCDFSEKYSCSLLMTFNV